MKITYLSCDGISVAIEEITKVEFCNSDRGGRAWVHKVT